MELVLGVDVSSRLLAVVGRTVGSNRSPLVMLQPLDRGTHGPFQAQVALRGFIETLVPIVRLVAIEAPAMGVSARSTILQSFVNGAVQATCVEAGMEVLLVPPATWKKDVVGHGNADKAAVAKWVGTHWPELATLAGGSQDIFDAAAVALHGEAVLRRSAALAR